MAPVPEIDCSQATAYLKVKELAQADNTLNLRPDNSPVIKDLKNELCVTYVVDGEDRFNYIKNRDVDRSGLSENEIHNIGVENLANLARVRIKITPYGNIFAVMLDGNFEASLILVDSLWENGLAHLAPNGFVVAIPTRDVLAFCDLANKEGLAELAQVVERVKGGDHRLSQGLYKRSDGGWRPFSLH